MKNIFKFVPKSLFASAFASVLFLSSCSDDNNSTNPINNDINATFAVVSDCHYFATSLGSGGKAFEDYLNEDRKLIAESQAINESVFNTLKNENFNFLLIPGDLTKDGEKVSHTEFAKLLTALEATGKKVYVVPGNHDVSNPHSVSYSGDNATPTASVTPEEFAQIYKEFGYGEAIAKDPNSLSYIAEPTSGVWLFAMDPCRYKENNSSPITSGQYSEATLAWIKSQLAKAKELGKTVIGMQHHGLVEHFTGQKSNPISKDYVIENWQSVATDFATLGMQAVFTGHFHANDITKFTAGGNSIYDIETGSLVTSPCPYRLVSLNNTQMSISTKKVLNISYNTNGKSFQEYAMTYTLNGMIDLAKHMLKSEFGATEEQATEVAPLAGAAFLAHYNGDEAMPAEIAAAVSQMQSSPDISSQLLAGALLAIYTDLNPSDNNVTFTLPKAASAAKMARK